ncbi:MAG: hypothetical protein ABUL67_00480 [Haliangium ochraceum]
MKDRAPVRAPARVNGVSAACLLAAVQVIAAVAAIRPARAVGLEGPEDAVRRFGVGLGAGVDQVGGIGRDAFPFIEAFAHGESRAWRWVAVGGAVTARGDIADYNFALGRWRGQSGGMAAQLWAGYDGPAFHLSAGSWWYGDSRDGRDFHVGFLPWGVIRLRAGHLDGWHLNLRIADGAPYTAEGGAAGVRLQVGTPPRGRHRLAVGLYTSVGEKTAGILVSDEIAAGGWGSSSLRLGAMVGTDLDHPGARPELTGFAGTVW